MTVTLTGPDADFASAKAAAFSEDQLFELVISTAVGQSARLYEADSQPWPEGPAPGRPMMRLDILNRGYGPATKMLFAIIRVFSGQPVPDAARLVFYRPGFYGTRAKKFTHEAMRGPSAWSVADRELMAAYVSKVNESAFCIGAHTATAGQAYRNRAKVKAVLTDLDSAPSRTGSGRRCECSAS